MQLRPGKFRVGLRTVKTVAAVIASMIVVDWLGTSTSKLIFAMLGAMAAVQPTFKESVESCLAQTIGVIFGAIAGVLLLALPIPSLVAVGIGMLLVITLYNVLHIRFSPSLPCFIVVMICTTPDIQPLTYALERIWDTAIGLGIGMLINMLIFPYDNSRAIRSAAESLDKELIAFLEEMFDGDEILPDVEKMQKQIDTMAGQLKLFSNQKLFLKRRRQRRQLDAFRNCESKARQLVAQMEVLSAMDRPGRLNDENRRRLHAAGAKIQDDRPLDSVMERDVVTNYHISRILTLRLQLLEYLQQTKVLLK